MTEFELRQTIQIRAIRKYCLKYGMTVEVGTFVFIEHGLAKQWADWYRENYEGVAENRNHNHRSSRSVVFGGV